MKKLLMGFFLVFSVFFGAAQAAEVEGFEIPDQNASSKDGAGINVGVFLRQQTIDVSSSYGVDAGSDVYNETQEFAHDLTFLGLRGAKHSLLATWKVEGGFLASGDASYNKTDNLISGCEGECGSPDLDGYFVKAQGEYTLVGLSPSNGMGHTYAFAGVELVSVSSSTFDHTGMDKSYDLDQQNIFAGMGYRTDFDKNIFIDVSAALVNSNTEVDYSYQTNDSSFVVKETGFVKNSGLGVAINATLKALFTDNLSGYVSLSTVQDISGSSSASKQLSFQNGVKVQNADVSVDNMSIETGLNYSF